MPAYRPSSGARSRFARRRVMRLLAASLILHALVVAVAVKWPRPEPLTPEAELAAPIAMIFEPRSEARRTTPKPTDIPSAPAPAPVPPPTATPAPAVASPLARPLGEPPQRQAMAVPPVSRPVPAPEQARPPVARPPASSFPAPMAYSLGSSSLGSARPRANASPDRSAGPAAVGPASFGQFAKVTQGHADPNWLSALHDWWLRHGYYPEQAVAQRQDGTVRVELVVDRFGKVRSVELSGRSGSPWLDTGALAVFRDARLPPFGPTAADDQITLDLTIQYRLIQR